MSAPRRRRDRSPVTRPGYHKGREPRNKHQKLRVEILTVREVRTLLDSFGQSPGGLRNHAMAWLMYRYGLKLIQLTQLEVADYARDKRQLAVAKTDRFPAATLELDAQTVALLDAWLESRKDLGIPRFAPLFCTYQRGEQGRRMRNTLIAGVIRRRGEVLGIEKRVHPESLRASGKAHRQRDSLEREMLGYLDEEAFQARYPRAYETWSAARNFAALDATRWARRIGEECRDSMATFTTELAALHGVDVVVTDGTIDRLLATVEQLEIPSRAYAASSTRSSPTGERSARWGSAKPTPQGESRSRSAPRTPGA